jgi:hypothetical protein
MLRLQGQQNDLNLKQNEILKDFSAQQERSSLPKLQIPIFAGAKAVMYNQWRS